MLGERHQNRLFLTFFGLLAGVFLFLYFTSPLRQRIEQKLFDLRTRMAPHLTDSASTVLIPISEETIQKLEPKEKTELSIPAMARITKTILALKPTRVVVLLHSQVFPYDQTLAPLLQIGRDHPNLLFCLFDVANLDLSINQLVLEPFTDLQSQVASCELPREFRREIVRRYPVANLEGVPFLAEFINDTAFPAPGAAAKNQSKEPDIEQFGFIHLHYLKVSGMDRFPAESVLENPPSTMAGKTVFVGYTAFRPWTFDHRESTHVNTPWQNDGDDVEHGFPLLYVQAIAAANMKAKAWLQQVSWPFDLLQVLLLTLAGFWIWRLGPGIASLIFIGGWGGILLFHSLLFSTIHWYFNLADSLVFSSLATICGAMVALGKEGRSRATREAQAISDQEVAQIQERFLDRFAFELGESNKKIKAQLIKHKALGSGTGTLQQAYVKAIGSSEELGEYLSGMQQFVNIKAVDLQSTDLVPVEINPVINTVMSQFESRLLETKITVRRQGLEGLSALGEKTLMTQIVFNFVSNAIKYSPTGTQITISGELAEDHVILAVTDQGPGISEDQQTKIFEKFYRIKNDLVHAAKGHGLGLYLCVYFANQMDAEIGVHSQVGVGSTFTLKMRAQK